MSFPRRRMFGAARLFSAAEVIGLAVWMAVAATRAVAGERPVDTNMVLFLTAPQDGWRGVGMNLQCPTYNYFTEDSACVVELEVSTNLTDWSSIATLHGSPFVFPDARTSYSGQLFYRATRRSWNAVTNDWKNLISYDGRKPTDDFDNFAAGHADSFSLGWVKFCILLSDPTRVYFQNSVKYPLHGDFATARLAPFIGMSRPEFDAVSLRTNGQQVILGTVLLPGKLGYDHQQVQREYGIQFTGLDPYPPEKIREWFKLVSSAVFTTSPEPLKVFYVPVTEQAIAAAAQAAFFASNNIAVTSPERWLPGNVAYSDGWALGRIRYFPGSEVSAAYYDGRLLPTDILLTDSVSAEVPFVAGIMTLDAATPNSHVAILAKAYGIPFAFLHDEDIRARALALVEEEVLFSAYANVSGYAQIQILETGALPLPLRTEILALKTPPPVNITPKAHYGSYVASTTNLVPSDSRYFGGKAANFGLLRRIIPTNSPPAIALSIDLWDDFMAQPFGPHTLSAEISNRLAGFTYPVTNLPALQLTLDGIRTLVRSASFTAAQREVLTNAMGGFTPGHRIRFRSSSNAEDAESFTAAGLLDSYSGCLADDMDGNTSGPSICDPTELNERGIFRAIQRVYSSFYNDNAFLERLRHGIRESDVGVGVLVHESFPDETELANGVATVAVTITPEPGSTNAFSEITFVTQPGAASVTNPSDDAQAEVVKLRVYAPDGGPLTYDNPRLQTRSSLLPFGQTTLTTNEFLSFAALIESLRAAYGAMFPAKTNYVLDLEYKKITPAALIIKQIREIPVAPSSNQYPFLISQPTEYVIWQGENTELDFNHALKIRARFTTKNLLLTETNFATTFFTALHLDYTDGSNVLHLDLEGDALTNLQHLVDGDWITDTLPPAADRPGFVFSMRKPQRISTTQNPWWTLADLELRRLGDDNHFVRLVPAPVITSTDSLQTRHGTYSFTLGATNLTVSITTRFYWPDQAGIAQAANTAPLLQFVSTTIEGLTTAPLLLTNHFSQTCAPSHHNLNDSFLFEPRLDANVTPAQLSELNTLNIRALHFRTGIGDCAENCTFIYPLVLVDD